MRRGRAGRQSLSVRERDDRFIIRLVSLSSKDFSVFVDENVRTYPKK
jgi:hypothetical protein